MSVQESDIKDLLRMQIALLEKLVAGGEKTALPATSITGIRTQRKPTLQQVLRDDFKTAFYKKWNIY